jgi:hypothetical protein
MFERVERLKAEWTDKYVAIASPAPELARFATATGLVKTVNMNGRCLVEFDQYNNVAWYDIDPSALKVVPKPLPKPAEAKPAKTAAAAPPAAAAKAAPAAGAKKASTADILAAARAKGGAAPAAKPAGTEKPATGAKLSTADILARARGAKAAAPVAPAAEPAPEAVADEPAAEPSPKPAAKPAAAGKLPTTTAEKIAWCRANDAKG